MTTQPATSLYAAYAADAAESYERYFVPAIGEPTARRLVAAAHPAPGERVLDVACGTGIAGRLARERVGAEGAVAGLDPNPGMLAVARTVAGDLPGTPITWHEAPAESIPLPDASVDVVLCSMGLQFFADRGRALGEIHRVLRPGGRVAWCTPGPTPPVFEAIDQALVHHVGPGASMFVHAVFSLHDPEEARGLMQDAGFGGVEVEATSLPLRLPPPRDFLWQYVLSTPLAAAVAEIDETERAALEAEVVERCQPFTEAGATLMEPGLLLVTGAARPA